MRRHTLMGAAAPPPRRCAQGGRARAISYPLLPADPHPRASIYVATPRTGRAQMCRAAQYAT